MSSPISDQLLCLLDVFISCRLGDSFGEGTGTWSLRAYALFHAFRTLHNVTVSHAQPLVPNWRCSSRSVRWERGRVVSACLTRCQGFVTLG